MDPSTLINQRVTIVAIYQRQGNQENLCQPVKMRYKNQDITFSELGMRHPTTAGKRMIHVFDMSDGVNDYRLEFDAEGLTWTLVSIIEGHHDRP